MMIHYFLTLLILFPGFVNAEPESSKEERNDAHEEALGYQSWDVPAQVPKTPKDADPSALKDALTKDITGIFYSGGGYVSHTEGLVLTWGWLNLLQGLSSTNPKKTLDDMFSNKIVSTNSGGGWFFNELLYSSDWYNAVASSDAKTMVSNALAFYTDVIANVYGVTTKEVEANTKDGTWTALSKGDYALLYTQCGSWQGLVEKHHYKYSSEPVMKATNLKWRSQIAILQEYGLGIKKSSYYMYSNRQVFTKSERKTWINSDYDGFPGLPAQYVFDFSKPSKNPEISLDIPVFDDWWGDMCSIRKTSKACSATSNCPANSFCDTDIKYCFCEAGFQANGNTCQDCSKAGLKYGDYQPAPGINIAPKKSYGLFYGPSNNIPIQELKEVVKASISSSPMLYSGPSSAAAALTSAESMADQMVFSTLHFEVSWKTPPMNNEVKTSIGLADGGGVDNCGLIGLVRHYQNTTLKNADITADIWTAASKIDETVLGMCALNDMSLLVTNMNYDGTMGDDERAKVYYPIFTLEEAASLQFVGKVLEVWSVKVKTLYEPINGILPGSTFTVFLFFFPQDKPRETQGLCRNMGFDSVNMDGYGNCAYNMVDNQAKKPEDQNPLLSLLLGRGETFEQNISLSLAAKDMQDLASALGYTSQTSNVKVAAAVNDILARLDHRMLAFGGVFVLVAFLFLRARKQAQEDSVYTALMNSSEQEI